MKQTLKYLGVILFIAAIIGVGFIFYHKKASNNSSQNSTPQPTADTFSGNILSYNGSTLHVKGIFEQDNRRVSTKIVEADIILTTDTKFEKEVLEMPKKSGAWNLSDLKRQVVPGSISDLQSAGIEGL